MPLCGSSNVLLVRMLFHKHHIVVTFLKNILIDSRNMNDQNCAPVAFLSSNGSDLCKYAWVEKKIGLETTTLNDHMDNRKILFKYPY